MMMMGNKKKMSTVIMGRLSEALGGNAKEVDHEKAEMDADSGYHAAAGDLISAIGSGDAKAAHRALLAHYRLCSVADDFQSQESAGREANQQNFND